MLVSLPPSTIATYTHITPLWGLKTNPSFKLETGRIFSRKYAVKDFGLKLGVVLSECVRFVFWCWGIRV